MHTPNATGNIEVRAVSKSYGIGLDRRTVIEDCSFSARPGELTVIIGPSGCGKSTLVRLLAGFERTDEGQVLCNDAVIRGPSRERLVVFQESALYPWMTTSENIAYGPKARGQWTAGVREELKALVRRVGLQQFIGSYPNQLSGGMQRRAELARAMINDPEVMILDEPFRGLDAMTKALMQEYYAQLFEEFRRTQLFVTTDIDEAIFLADRILVMSNTPMQVREEILVDLPRPRKLADIFESDSANEIKMRALSVLHEEAMRSFRKGSRAASDFIAAYGRRVSGP